MTQQIGEDEDRKKMMIEFMKNGVDLKELKEIEKKILKGISLKDSFSNIKTVAAFSIYKAVSKKYPKLP